MPPASDPPFEFEAPPLLPDPEQAPIAPAAIKAPHADTTRARPTENRCNRVVITANSSGSREPAERQKENQ
jgi:hypothetical protein